MTGPITALTWALEVGEYGAVPRSRGHQLLRFVQHRGEFWKYRATHTAVEAQQGSADDADRGVRLRNSPALAMLYDREKQKSNANRATLAVVRKLVAYPLAVDPRQKDFLVVENETRSAA